VPEPVNRNLISGNLDFKEKALLRTIGNNWTYKANRLLQLLKEKEILNGSDPERVIVLDRKISRYIRKLYQLYSLFEFYVGTSKAYEARTADLVKTEISKGEARQYNYEKPLNEQVKKRFKLF
jgi:hypothetical protein